MFSLWYVFLAWREISPEMVLRFIRGKILEQAAEAAAAEPKEPEQVASEPAEGEQPAEAEEGAEAAPPEEGQEPDEGGGEEAVEEGGEQAVDTEGGAEAADDTGGGEAAEEPAEEGGGEEAAGEGGGEEESEQPAEEGGGEEAAEQPAEEGGGEEAAEQPAEEGGGEEAAEEPAEGGGGGEEAAPAEGGEQSAPVETDDTAPEDTDQDAPPGDPPATADEEDDPTAGEDTMVDAAVLEKLEAGFAKLAASDSKSLLKKYLTKEVFDNLKTKKTPTFGSTLLDVIQSGLENHDSGVGIYAPDAEAYSVFADLFDPIIEDYHGGFKKTDKHPPKDWGDVDTMGNLDPAGEYIISTRVRCGRSMQGYPFNPCLTEAQYKEMEEKVSSTLSGLEGELKGQFYPLTGMTKEVQQKLIDDHFLFKEGDRFLQAANACRFWPTGRGIYHNDAKTFLVWCNEEDHLRIISMQMGGDLGQVYRRLVTAVNDIEKRIPFSHDDRLGFLTFCPTNLGTTVRASVHIKVPKLAADKAKLEEVAGKYNLQVRGTRGEHTEAEGGVYDISNKRRMGLTEYDAVKEMNDGIAELIKLESSM